MVSANGNSNGRRLGSLLTSLLPSIFIVIAAVYFLPTTFVNKDDFQRQVALRSQELNRMQDERSHEISRLQDQIQHLLDAIVEERTLVAKIQDRQDVNNDAIRDNRADFVKIGEALDYRLRALESYTYRQDEGVPQPTRPHH